MLPDDRKAFPDDIFIPRKVIHGAVDGDQVEAEINPYSWSEKGPEGKVIKVLKRGRSHVAGTVTYVDRKGQSFAYVPILGEEKIMRVLPSKKRKLKVGDRLIIHVVNWGGQRKESVGEMSSYIGHISDPSCDNAAAIEEFGLKSAFPEEVIEEAKSFGEQVSSRVEKGRKDLRHLNCITIDPATAKDFDDALSLHKEDDGTFSLGVHIADVSYYVKPNSALDTEAQERCNSVYFPGSVIPMLPHELSSHLCSLKPNVNRLAISVLMTLDSQGKLTSYEICRSLIRSKRRFAYEEAKEILDGNKKSAFLAQLKLMVELCALLKKKRVERGSIEFALPDIFIEVTEGGEVRKIDLVEYDITHQMVEEFMLLANEVVATHLSKQGKSLTYRIHDEPNAENLSDFAQTANLFGFRLSSTPTVEELQKLFDEARESPFGQFLAIAFIRSMKLASYSTQNIGHYGLGLEYYTHFTSPIRRYIDLLVHRVLFDEIEKQGDLEALAVRCSEKERLSAKAETALLLLKKLRFLQKALDEGKDTYRAVVASIKPFGSFFELESMLFEGFLPPLEEKLTLGSKIIVRLKEVNLVTRETVWEFLTNAQRGKEESKKGGKTRARK